MKASLDPAGIKLLKRLILVAVYYLLLNLLAWPIYYFIYDLSHPPRVPGGPRLICNPWECVYFSVITCTTTGYGDISPTTWRLQALAVLQILSSLAIIVFWLGYVFTRYGNVRS